MPLAGGTPELLEGRRTALRFTPGRGRSAEPAPPRPPCPLQRCRRSLAWTNSFTRVTKHYPGRLVFLGVNLLIALVLMEASMFDFLNNILGFYANCGMSWLVVVATDIAINKYLLKLSPIRPEFRGGMRNPSGEVLRCHVCEQDFERPDVTACAAHDDVVCSLCLSTDRTGEHVLPAAG